jgi:hypothetical protein
MVMLDAFIFKVLDISTGHMTQDDNQVLELNRDTDGPMPAYELKEYGWLVYVGELEDNWKEDMSPAFVEVLKKAQELGCDYVRFDRDGRVYDELPTFEW